MDDEFEDSGSECVICMCETRDTLILPCRHLCLCNCCADNLRYQASNCPICRVKFCALLQIRAIRRKIPCAPLGLGIQPQVRGRNRLYSMEYIWQLNDIDDDGDDDGGDDDDDDGDGDGDGLYFNDVAIIFGN